MNSKQIIGDILTLIDYQGDRGRHAHKLHEVLNKSIQIAYASVIEEFFKDYINSVTPTLNDQQKNKLKEYFESLQKESIPASGTSAQ